MKVVEENNEVENEVMKFERMIEERLEENINLFNGEEITIIKNNSDLVEKIYLLGILDVLI